MDDPGGVAGENRDPVLLAENADRGLEMQIHAERGCHRGRLVDLARPDAPDADLLQRHDVGIAGGDDLGDPVR